MLRAVGARRAVSVGRRARPGWRCSASRTWSRSCCAGWPWSASRSASPSWRRSSVRASVGRATLEAVEGLRRRSLLERTERGPLFGLHSVVLEYVTEQLIEDVAQELASGEPDRLLRQPLLKATAKDYVRRSQERLIAAPIVERLVETRGSARAAEQRLMGLLDEQRGRPVEDQGYGPGNLVNLLRLLRGDLKGVDLSGPVDPPGLLAGRRGAGREPGGGPPLGDGARRGVQLPHVAGAQRRRRLPGGRDGERRGLPVAGCRPHVAGDPAGARRCESGPWR